MLPRSVSRSRLVALLAGIFAFLLPIVVDAQCPGSVVTNGLNGPNKLIQTPSGNLLVAESGIQAPNTGRISIVGLDGTRRTVLDGLPSGRNAEGKFTGTQALFQSGRMLYVLTGEGDSTLSGPIIGTEVPNPVPSSPIASSVLAVQFTGSAESIVNGFALTLSNQESLKSGQSLNFSNGGNDGLSIRLLADLPDYVADPLPYYPQNVRPTVPSSIVGTGNDLFIADSGRNAIFRIDISTGRVSLLTSFPTIPNPTSIGPANIDAVPSSIHELDSDLLVTLMRGYPYLSGNSSVVRVNKKTGEISRYMDGWTTLVDVWTVKAKGWYNVFTLEYSLDLATDQPGRFQRFETASFPAVPISTCLNRPSGFVRDEKSGAFYITESTTGKIIRINP